MLAEEVTYIDTHFTKRGRAVFAMLMQGYGKCRWWEPDDANEPSWWSETSSWSQGSIHALRVDPDGTSHRIEVHPDLAPEGSPYPTISANGFSVSFVANQAKNGTEESSVGRILVATARSATLKVGDLRVYTSTEMPEPVFGSVVLRPTADTGIIDLESRAHAAVEWSKRPVLTDTFRAITAVGANILPDRWDELEKTVGEVLQEHATGLIAEGPMWEAVLMTLMTGLLEDGVVDAAEFRRQHAEYSSVIRHLSTGGDVGKLLDSIVPKWMRNPADLSS